MSRLQELMDELRPEGIKYVPLGELTHYSSNFAEAKIEHERAEMCCKTGILEECGTIRKEKRQAIIYPLKVEASGARKRKLLISRKFGTTGGNSVRRRAKKPGMSNGALLIWETVLARKVAIKTFYKYEN